jgi:multidrug efflux pump subunit AcrA (membrane-fusion protein)
MTVNDKKVVEQRQVRIGALVGDLRVIESGLKPEDRVVIDGLQRAIPGQTVDPQTGEIAGKKSADNSAIGK